MSRRQLVLMALKACGAEDDRKNWIRLYVENRVSLKVANEQWKQGQQLAKFIIQRDTT